MLPLRTLQNIINRNCLLFIKQQFKLLWRKYDKRKSFIVAKCNFVSKRRATDNVGRLFKNLFIIYLFIPDVGRRLSVQIIVRTFHLIYPRVERRWNLWSCRVVHLLAKIKAKSELSNPLRIGLTKLRESRALATAIVILQM